MYELETLKCGFCGFIWIPVKEFLELHIWMPVHEIY